MKSKCGTCDVFNCKYNSDGVCNCDHPDTLGSFCFSFEERLENSTTLSVIDKED